MLGQIAVVTSASTCAQRSVRGKRQSELLAEIVRLDPTACPVSERD